jgi:hypothetical protein
MYPVFSNFGATKTVSISGFVFDEVHDIGTTWEEICASKNSSLNLYQPIRKVLAGLVRLSLLRRAVNKDLKERIRAAARTATAEIRRGDSGD